MSSESTFHSRPAIVASGLSKKYELYPRPGDRLKEWLCGGKRKLHQDFWALRDLYFEVPFRSTVGIIGANGAGKSTLLKLLLGTTRPTTGELTLNGRVAGILELGAGFHPEFSGRSNVYMNCSIMGMDRPEIEARIEDILAFSELGDFIDQPVKTYSTGMYMRLAFAVAISVDPDILVSDEVLAVGDEHFREKCLRKINEFRESGKTILFVSHDLATIRSLCDKVIFLNGGRIVAQGTAEEVADQYLNWVHAHAFEKMKILNESQPLAPPRWGSGEIELLEIKLLNQNGEENYAFYPGDFLEIRASYQVKKNVEKPVFGFNIYRNDGTLCLNNNHVANAVDDDRRWSRSEAVNKIQPRRAGETGTASFVFSRLPLVHGIYRLTFSIYDAGKALPLPIDEIEGVKTFQVEKDGIGRTGVFTYQGSWEFSNGAKG